MGAVSTQVCYTHTEHLLGLDQLRPEELPLWFLKGPSPLRAEIWRQGLASHPDQRFASYVMQGIEAGFRIGADRSIPLKPAKTNMQSAGEHPAVIEDYLAEEVRLGRLLPLPSGTCVHISQFGVIPKGLTPDRWRMITDLSSPHGVSVNDAIEPELCSLEYITVDTVARRAWQMGPGALLAKAYVKSDDFAIVGPLESPTCANHLHIF